jgi:hypothetical protein
MRKIKSKNEFNTIIVFLFNKIYFVLFELIRKLIFFNILADVIKAYF